jgi:two-component system nitrogen regulation response regulator NtrX
MIKNNILVVDDEQDILDLIADVIEDEGYQALKARSSQQAFQILSEKIPEAVILDIWLKDSELDGLGVLEFIKAKYPEIPVIMISGHGNIETAVKSLKIGAYDYLEKPFKKDKMVNVLNKAVENFRLKLENFELKSRFQKIDFLYGESNSIKQLKNEITKLAAAESRLFMRGEIGVGKEIIAEKIHNSSKRRNSAFITLNVSQHKEADLDAIIFGTEDTGLPNTPARKIGLLELANGGTLYINEITGLPTKVQDKLLKFLVDGKFTHAGGTKILEANVRFIVATYKDIEKRIAAGLFRSDLYHRLNVVSLQIPSLKDRRDDVPAIANYFIDLFSKKYNLPRRGLAEDALISLQSYDWPGNVRQLQNVIEWLLIMYPGEESDLINAAQLPKEVSSAFGSLVSDSQKELMSMKLRDAREIFEKQYLVAQINRFGGNISRTANFIGMERSALHRKLKSLSVFDEGDELDGQDNDASASNDSSTGNVAA